MHESSPVAAALFFIPSLCVYQRNAGPKMRVPKLDSAGTAEQSLRGHWAKLVWYRWICVKNELFVFPNGVLKTEIHLQHVRMKA